MNSETLKKTLESSIARAEEELKHCQEELAGIREVSNIHRNSFHYIAGIYGGFSFYFDADDSEYQILRTLAKDILNERETDSDSICRKYLDIELMIGVFQQDADAGGIVASFDLRDLQDGGLIRGDHVLNYAASLMRKGSSEGFEAYSKITDERLSSSIRRDSVQREMGIFRDYIGLCRKKLGDL